MAATKCSKCGADIPASAGFCPSCGAPKAATAVVHQPPQTNPMQSGRSPLEGLFNMAFSTTAVIIVSTIGALLGWVGQIIFIFSSENWKIAVLLSSMGFGAMGLFLIGGGIWNKKINNYTRLAMVIIGGFIIFSSMSVMSFFGNNSSGWP